MTAIIETKSSSVEADRTIYGDVVIISRTGLISKLWAKPGRHYAYV